MAVEQSILKSTKTMLDIAADDPSFDSQVIGHINSALATLNDLGVGPAQGLFIADDATQWTALGEDPVLTQQIRNYLFLKVKLVWDPPDRQFVHEALKEQILEAGGRLVNAKDRARYEQMNQVVI